MTFNYFYNNTITITVTESGGELINGIWHNNNTSQSYTIKCDVQPTGDALKEADYGAATESDYKVFLSSFIPSLSNHNAVVTYGGKEYTIIKIVDWSDYQILYIKAVT